jgi:hypothetical protein
MHAFRVPYPSNPTNRRTFFERFNAEIARFGTIEGDLDAGEFHGSTPIGKFAGAYRKLDDADEIEIKIHKKPLFITSGMIEREAKKFLASLDSSDKGEG